MSDALSTTAEALTQAYRPIRPLRGGVDAPWDGMLVAVGEDQRRMLVDQSLLPKGWGGWSAERDGHLMAALDVCRRGDGHDVMLPTCRERVMDFLERRSASGVQLSSGERVTLAVSVLRALAEVARGGGASPGERPGSDDVGEWWMTDEGKPVLVTGVGGSDVYRTCNEVLAAIADRGDARWESITAPVSSDVRAHELAGREDDAFAVAAPAALVTSPLTTGRYGVTEAAPVQHAEHDRGEQPAAAASVLSRVVRHIDDDLADAVSRATTAVWRRASAPRRTARGAPWVLAATIAVIIVAVGWFWPDSSPSAEAEAVSIAGAGAVSDADEGSSAHSPDDRSAVKGEDIRAAADQLLTSYAACGADDDCRRALLSRPGVQVPDEPAFEDQLRRVLTVIDDFGGVVVLRAEAVDSSDAPRIVVIERRDDSWLLRDVYDAAQQP